MSRIIIAGNPLVKRIIHEDDYSAKRFMNVAEFFCDTIQGENFVGQPAAFLRVQGCTQSCVWCDTREVWRFGNPYTFDELYVLIQSADLVRKFKEGQHLVLTGGSPVLQQDRLVPFIDGFIHRFGFKPFIEIENECTLMPSEELIAFVDLWNNSPKLNSSGNRLTLRYQPEILRKIASLKNSWFKFVVSDQNDWDEIDAMFLQPHIIRRDQIVLMPLGATRAELIENREKVIDIAIRYNVRYSTREHIVVWDKRTGI